MCRSLIIEIWNFGIRFYLKRQFNFEYNFTNKNIQKFKFSKHKRKKCEIIK